VWVDGLKQLFQLPRREQPFSADLSPQNRKQVRLCGLGQRDEIETESRKTERTKTRNEKSIFFVVSVFRPFVIGLGFRARVQKVQTNWASGSSARHDRV
jgi:hypothetical protein